MYNILSIMLFLNLTFTTCAQNPDLQNKMMNFGKHLETNNWSYQNLFFDHKLSPGLETMFLSRTNNTVLVFGGSSFQQTTYSEIPVIISFGNYTFEPRINVWNGRRKSIFVKAPTGISLSITTSKHEEFRAGFMHFHTGLLFGFGSGLNSVARNSERKGFSFSAGVQYFRAPILGLGIKDEFYFHVKTLDGSKYRPNKNYFLPTIQVDLFKINRKNKPRGYSWTIGAYKEFYLKFGWMILQHK